MAAVAQEKRVALVIGNAAYSYVAPLRNPANDANDISEALQQNGFEVVTGIDLDLAGIEGAIDEFVALASDADVVLFYFAGHAFQVESRNYLVPVDLGRTGFEGDLSAVLDDTYMLDHLIERLRGLDAVRLIILDACRDNPLGIENADVVGAGLARIEPGEDFWIALATRPGAVAYDGDGRNGVFTEYLLHHIHAPGQSLAEMMISVRSDVVRETGGKQVPFEISSLTREFSFAAGRRTSPDGQLFQAAARLRDPELMSLYLSLFPRGPHVEDAKELLDASRSIGDGAASAPGAARGLSADGVELWEVVKRTRSRPLAEYFLKRFPDSPFAELARRMTEVLPQPWELEPGEHCERLATHPHDATAAIAGISLDALREISFPAMQTCRAAADAFPEQPRFLALLARATFAAGREAEAIALYREAADRGDLRALVSLGLLTERQDAQLAISYYERAAEGGSTDGAINLASALMDGKVIPQDIPRAIEMFRQAAEAGAPLATFNLGVLALEGTNGTPAEALELFRRAARDGFPPGYRAAASMLAEGSAVPGNPAAAAELLLRGAAEDDGEIIKRINNGDDQWLGDTIAEVQERLAAAGIYDGPRDGIAGPEFVNALWAWRRGGFDASVLTADLPADVP